MRRNKQRGAVVLLILALLVGAGAFWAMRELDAGALRAERDRITTAALARAKEALIGYAVMRDIRPADPSGCSPDCPRPGDLPCPDMDNDGDAETACGNESGSSGQAERLGRLPWRTLRLPDLRDGSGERLWYAVSNNFKNNDKTDVLNSDSLGTISLRNSAGQLVHDGAGASGASALIIAPGAVIARIDTGSLQDRGCRRGASGDSVCVNNDACTSPTPALTARCNPVNYLDVWSGVDNNAAFIDGSGADGFVAGEVRDDRDQIVVNDRILALSRAELMARVEERVVAEVRLCLESYAANNFARYPWAASSALDPLSSDVSGSRFGRVPLPPFDDTDTDSANSMATAWSGTASACAVQQSFRWWTDNKWNELVFYALSNDVAPAAAPASACGAGCLALNTPSGTQGKSALVILAGAKLAFQSRITAGDKDDPRNYLEGENATLADDTFDRRLANAPFNDSVSAIPRP